MNKLSICVVYEKNKIICFMSNFNKKSLASLAIKKIPLNDHLVRVEFF